MSAMKISCVIPTYNSAGSLRLGLEALSLQRLPRGVELEVIVVDDGSTDDTSATVELFRKTVPNLRYTFRPRDASANRSRARNRGIALAEGDAICFLDAGVIVPPDFIARAAARSAEQPGLVLAHETFGLSIDPEREDMSVLDGFAVDRLDAYLPRIKQLAKWSDPRAMTARMVRDDLSLLSAPWTEGWSCALTVPASLIDGAGVFDESFSGWGLEDVEFAYRLHGAGARWGFERKACAVHYPHPVSRSKEKQQSLRDNMWRMHRKHGRLDTECYPLFYGLHFQAFLEKMNDLKLPELSPPAPMPPQGGEVLAVGFDSAERIRSLGASHALVYRSAACDELRRQLPEREVRYLLGVYTPFGDKAFEIVYVSDVVRVVHPYVARLLLKEAHRIGRRTVWVHSESERSPYPEVAPEVSERLNELFRLPPDIAGATFKQEYVPSARRRLVMEKPYWTGKEEILSLAAREGLELERLTCRAPIYRYSEWGEA